MAACETTTPHATGPKTLEGKARSSKNAMKHGFTCKNIFIPEGMRDDFEQLVEGYSKDIRPEGAIEDTLFNQLVRNAWTLKRIEIRQTEMAESGSDPLAPPKDDEKEAERLERYYARYQGAFRATLRELRAIQTSRYIQKAIPEPLGIGSFPVTVKASEIVQLAKRSHPNYSAISITHLQDQIASERAAGHENNGRRTEREIEATPISFKDFLTPKEITRF